MSDSVRPHRRQPTRLPHPWDSPGKNTGVGCHSLLQCRKVKSESEVAQSCPTLRDPMDCSLPGPSVHGIFQARVLEWGAIAFSRDLQRASLNSLAWCWSIHSYEETTQRWRKRKHLKGVRLGTGLRLHLPKRMENSLICRSSGRISKRLLFQLRAVLAVD